MKRRLFAILSAVSLPRKGKDVRRLQIGILLVIGLTPFYLNGLYNPHLVTTPRLFWAMEIVAWAVLPLALYFAGRRAGLFSAVDLGLHTSVGGSPRPWILPLALMVAPFVMVWMDSQFVKLATALSPATYGASAFRYEDMIPPRGPSTGGYRLLAIAYLALTAGLVEGFYYLGMTRLLFRSGWVGAVPFMVASVVLFAGSHWEGGTWKLVYALAWGIAMAVVYAAIRNLWPIAVAHTVVDLTWFW